MRVERLPRGGPAAYPMAAVHLHGIECLPILVILALLVIVAYLWAL